MLRKVSVEIQVLRKGGFLGVLRGFHDNPPSIKMETDGSIKTVFQGTFEPYVYNRNRERVDFNPFTDEIRPILIVNKIAYKLGIYIPVSVTPSYDDIATEETISVEAYDRAWYVNTTTGKERVYFKKGTLYLDAVEQLLAASGIALIKKEENDAVFTEDREDWELGTDYLSIVNDLLTEINYKQLWFDFDGVAVLEPLSFPNVSQIQHVLDSRDPLTLVHPGLSRKTDLYKTPNYFICVCNNPEKSSTYKAVAKNTNPHSPLSIQRRGREIISLVTVANIANQTTLQRYADQLLFESLMTGEIIEAETSLLPDWGVGDVVSLHYNDVHSLCVSKSWSMTLKAGGSMQHTLEKIAYNFSEDVS